MQPIKVCRRQNWRKHIEENAYQVEALTDKNYQYWIESLDQPFAVQFSVAEETAIADATEALWVGCVEFLDWFFTEETPGEVDNRLAQLKIRPEYWQAIKNSWERENPEDLALATRFDLAMSATGDIKLLEINGETPLLGAETVYQWNWLVDYKHNYKNSQHPLPKGASQLNEYWEEIAGQWRRIAETYNLRATGISFLVDEQLEEDYEMASQLIQIIQEEVDPEIYTQIVYLRDVYDEKGNLKQRGLGLDDDGYFIDHVNERIKVLWKIYDWCDLQNDVENFGCTQVLAKRLARGDIKVIEPLWKQVLSNKASLVLMWDYFQDSQYAQYLLPSYLENDLATEATKLHLGTHVKKPIIGAEGVGISIVDGSVKLDSRENLGYGEEGFLIQEYVNLPEAFGYFYMIGSWCVDGTSAGIILRGDRSRITGRNCLIIPHIVSDEVLYLAQ